MPLFKNKDTNLFTIITQILLIILPFYVIIKVFFENKLWISGFWILIKEFLILILVLILIFHLYKDKIKTKIDILDISIFSYFLYWIIISLYNWINLIGIIQGWRYDFIFLIVLLIFKHGSFLIKRSKQELIKIFIISSFLSLFLWVFVKIIWEEILLNFWYIEYLKNWNYTWGIPIYHWLEGSGWIRRFQWILDSPNSMAFFIISITWILVYYIKWKLKFIHIILILVNFYLLILTYSRSAILWILISIFIIILLNIKKLLKKYKKYLLFISISIILLSSIFYINFQEKINKIFIRNISSKWHYERMIIWIERFIEKPFWNWLSKSGPWFRSTHKEKEIIENEKFYIPESWFIQQLVEWWIIYFSLFIMIFCIILIRLYKENKIIFFTLISILVMNLFLHSFESTYISILLFIFIWITLSNKNSGQNKLSN